jgi:hypothetical protein
MEKIQVWKTYKYFARFLIVLLKPIYGLLKKTHLVLLLLC